MPGSNLSSTSSASGREPAHETRGISVWYTAFETKEKADQMLADLERAGLNTIYGMVYWYRAFFPSNQFARADWVGGDWDPIDYLIGECHKRGWEFHAWFVNARIDEQHTPDFDRWEQWRVINADGKQEAQRLDYNVPEVRDREVSLMLEFVERYPQVDGIQFDYIRQAPPAGHYAYTAAAREAYKAEMGLDPWELVSNKAAFSAEEHERLMADWLKWQRGNLTSVVRRVHEGTRAINPDADVGAAVFSPPSRAEDANQFWWEWVEAGLLDYVKPMHYENNQSAYASQLEACREVLGDNWPRAIMPIGVLPSERYEDDPQLVAKSIEQVRAAGGSGVFLFRYGMADEVLDLLADRVFREPAQPAPLPPSPHSGNG